MVMMLDDDALANLGITNAEIVEAIEDVLRAAREGQISAAPKSSVIAPDGRYMMATLSASDQMGVIVVKSVMVNDRNKAAGRPGINGGIMLLDAETGALRAVFGANWVTAVRTAGLSAVAAKRLANPASETLGLIGTGVQAESHLRAFHDIFPLSHVCAFGRGTSGIEKIENVAKELGLSFTQADAKTVLERSDIVVSSVTLDYSIEPFLDANWLKPGAFAAITDLGIPWKQSGQTRFDRVFVDDLAQEKSMEKKMVSPGLITGELADLVVDGAQYDPTGPSAFIFRGIALGDLAVASLALHKATARG